LNASGSQAGNGSAEDEAIEFRAAPQRAEPASKKRMDARKVALMLKKAYSFPNTS
jgi:hypothetical protein